MNKTLNYLIINYGIKKSVGYDTHFKKGFGII